MVVFGRRRTCRGGSDWIAPRKRTRCTGNGHADTPDTYYKRPPTTPRAASPLLGRLKKRSCATRSIKLGSWRQTIWNRFFSRKGAKAQRRKEEPQIPLIHVRLHAPSSI